jgi:hypothetical protein
MAQALPFGEWLEVVNERYAKRAAAEAARREEEAAKRAETQARADVAFKAWDVEKTVHDTALEVSTGLQAAVNRPPHRARRARPRPAGAP